VAVHYNTKIITEGLVLCLDAANSKSLSSSSSNFVDLNTSRVSTITGTYAYNTALYSTPVLAINNDGVNSDGQVQVVTDNLNSLALTQNFSVMFAAKKNFFGIAGNNVGNSQLFQGVTNGFTTGWRIYDNNQGTQGAAFSNRHYWGFGYNDQNTSLTVNDSASTTNRICIVAFTISTTSIFGFCNGTTNSRSNPLTYQSGTSTPRISFTGAGAGSWNGLLGFFMIYNRALSTDEINQNFNALRGRYGL
jgi:hypothetical protein